MKIKQADIFLADLNPVKGHEQSGYRPVLVLQNNVLNKNLNTVVIAPITSNLKADSRLTTYFLDKNISKLNRNSIVLLFQIRTIDKERARKKISELKNEDFLKIKKQLRYIF
ncbi:type II toxin-antitoxin system PemK/MazF family toxin [Candidatus Parcubacteria bacterium]|nr:type II toxin-antitoxin system PemK/MazF family toxin [Candidatus Parcubacteria bacterium]